MLYPKMQTLWKRDKEDNMKIIPGDFTKQEFLMINHWRITEKLDKDYLKFHGVLKIREQPSWNTYSQIVLYPY